MKVHVSRKSRCMGKWAWKDRQPGKGVAPGRAPRKVTLAPSSCRDFWRGESYPSPHSRVKELKCFYLLIRQCCLRQVSQPGTTDTWGCPVHHRVFSVLPGLRP